MLLHRVPWQLRSHAALALGLSGDPLVVRSLVDLAQRAPESDRDLRGCAVTALGLIESVDDRPMIDGLLELLDDEGTAATGTLGEDGAPIVIYSSPPSPGGGTITSRTIVASDNEVSNGFVKDGKRLPYVCEATESGK